MELQLPLRLHDSERLPLALHLSDSSSSSTVTGGGIVELSPASRLYFDLELPSPELFSPEK